MGAGDVFTATVVVTGTEVVTQFSASVMVSVYTPAAVTGAAVSVGESIPLIKPSGPAQLYV
jgi:hypothetical protein